MVSEQAVSMSGAAFAWRIVDLTLPIQDGMDSFPGEPTAAFSQFSKHEDGGIEMWNVSLFSQLATHVDAPSHFLPDATTVERVPLEACIGPATVVDMDAPTITRDHLQPHEASIRRYRRVLIRTGWAAEFGHPHYWTGFPELRLDAVQALIGWGVSFLGLDTPSPSRHELHEVHQALLGAGVVLAECLTNLSELTDEELIVICLPLPLVGLDGSPSRIVGLQRGAHD